MDSAASKDEMRQILRQRVASLHSEALAPKADEVARHTLSLPEVEAAQGVLCCLSFGLEVDTWQLVERLRAAGKLVYVPRVEARQTTLHVHPYPCTLRKLSFGLRQPVAKASQLPEDAINQHLDCALILGLGFDHQGFRLGYGGGYFDRFLARHRVFSVGLGYQAQRIKTLPNESHDIPMHAVVTEDGAWRSPPPNEAQLTRKVKR